MNNELKTEKIEQKYNNLKSDYDSLMKDVSKIPDKTKTEYKNLLLDIEMKKMNLEDKFNHFKDSTADASQDIQSGFKEAVNDFEDAFKSAKSRFTQ